MGSPRGMAPGSRQTPPPSRILCHPRRLPPCASIYALQCEECSGVEKGYSFSWVMRQFWRNGQTLQGPPPHGIGAA